jgi:hypothetical protein
VENRATWWQPDLVRLELEKAASRIPCGFWGQLERGEASWQWSLDATAFSPSAARAKLWAEKRFEHLDEPRALTSPVQMRACTVAMP